MSAGQDEVMRAVQIEGLDKDSNLSKDAHVSIRLLLSNSAAGIIIGKGGQNRNELQKISAAKINLSRNNEFYPGTTERVLLLSGSIKSVLTVIYHIQIKINGLEDNEQEDLSKVASTQVKIVMPAAVCGAIIGKAGQTIKNFSQDSGTSISVSPQDKFRGQDYDRILTIAGGLEQLLRAVALVLSKVASNPSYNSSSRPVGTMQQQQPQQQYNNWYPESGAPPPQYMSHSQPLIPSTFPQSPSQGPRTEVTMLVAEGKVGAMMGKGGEIVTGLKRLLNVRISVSGREDYEPGTTNRKVLISGSGESVQMAQMIITQKLQQASLNN